MANGLTEREADILTKDKAAVETLLGKPAKVGFWTNTTPPEGGDAAAIAAYEAEVLDEIWIYTNGRVHFSLAGTAVKVDDKVGRDLPPPEPDGGTLVA
jgi:hypothetical protein